MCGIVAFVGNRPAVPVVVDGLRRLEYRGYDSAGLALPSPDGVVKVHKTRGRVNELAALLSGRLSETAAIAHTRWATHGRPTDVNAHPHTDACGRVAIVHNGIIENADEVRAKLAVDDISTVSDTDTELLAHLIGREVAAGTGSLAAAVQAALTHIAGTYGIAVMDAERPDEVVVACDGSPLVIGVGVDETLAASDIAAIAGHATQVVYLEDGEVATLRAGGYTIVRDGQETTRRGHLVAVEEASRELGSHDHWMQKEIREQPAAVGRVLLGHIDDRNSTVLLPGLNLSVRDLRSVRRVVLLGCGSAHFAGRLGAALIEEIARIPAIAEPASEFRYRNPVVDTETLYVAVSQSGETYDTLAAVQEVQRKGGRVIGIVNTVGSAIARQCDGGTYLHAGPEVSVTSTKTYTSTAVACALLAIHLGRMRGLSPAAGQRLIGGLRALPGQMEQVLLDEGKIALLAEQWARYSGMLFIGRVRGAVTASEGALKLKEVAYIHAEALPASELKHGPLALISPNMPVVSVIPDDELIEKNLATVAEIHARDGRVLAIGHSDRLHDHADDVILVPRSEPEFDPILLGIPLQLFAYHVAVALELDVDRPRNLAKSVTVE